MQLWFVLVERTTASSRRQQALQLLCAGLLFRSACPNSATAADVKLLRDQLKVKQLVCCTIGQQPG